MPLNNPNDPGYGVYSTEQGLVSTATPGAYQRATYIGRSTPRYHGRELTAQEEAIRRFDREQAEKKRAEARYEKLSEQAETQGEALQVYDKNSTPQGFVVYKRGIAKTDENIDWALTHTYYADYEKKITKYQETISKAGKIASDYNFQSIDPQVEQSQLASQRYSMGRGTTPKQEFDYSVARQQVYSEKLHDYATAFQESPDIIGTGTAPTKYVIGGAVKFVGDWFLESSGAVSRMAIGGDSTGGGGTGYYGASRQIKERPWETAGLGFDVVTFGGGAVYRKTAMRSLQKYGVGFFGKTSKVGKAFTYVKGKTYTPLKLQIKKISKLVPIDDAGGLGLRVTGSKVSSKGGGVATESLIAQVGKDASISLTKTSTSRAFGIGKAYKDDIVAGVGRTERLKWSSLKGGGTMISQTASQYKSPSFFAYVGQSKKVKDFTVSGGKIFMEQKRWLRKGYKKIEVPFISVTKKSKKFVDEAGDVMFGEKGK